MASNLREFPVSSEIIVRVARIVVLVVPRHLWQRGVSSGPDLTLLRPGAGDRLGL
jgi:hypothetical protein